MIIVNVDKTQIEDLKKGKDLKTTQSSTGTHFDALISYNKEIVGSFTCYNVVEDEVFCIWRVHNLKWN